MAESKYKRGAIPWMAKNPVAANLLLALLLIGGLLSSRNIRQEVFPEFELDTITITVPYPGASPEEVENGIILSIEEAVRGLDGVKRVTSTATEGLATISIELMLNTDNNRALQDVKNEIDRITTLPELAEEPNVSLLARTRPVIELVIYGDFDENVFQKLGEEVRDELLAKPEITNVEWTGLPPVEINVEISQATMRKYGLTLPDVAKVIKASSKEYTAGGVETKREEILLRIQERREYASEFENIPIIVNPEGSKVTLGNIASVTDGFEDTDEASFFNGKRAIRVEVSREGDQTPIEVAAAVRDYIEELRERLPEGMKVAVFNDRSEIYKDRLDLLLRNGALGAILVMITLGMFLNLRLAFWVMMGIPTSFLGALFLLPAFDVSINMISLFAFIIAVGIVVDDAIVVGENIYTKRREGMSYLQASMEGAGEIAVPVVLAVLTNIMAFLPLLFVTGIMGKVMRVVPIVVILVFTISLIESLFILPAHLAHSGETSTRGLLGAPARMQMKIANGLEWMINNVYSPFLKAVVRNRYLTFAIGIAILLITLAYVASGRLAITFAPNTEGDSTEASLVLPYGTPVEDTYKVHDRILKAAYKVIEKNGGEKISEGILSRIGASGGGSNVANIRVYLVDSGRRNFTVEDFTNAWRDEVGEIPGIESLKFETDIIGPPSGDDIDVELKHRNMETLEKAATELADRIARYKGVGDVDNGFELGKTQLDYRLTPEAYALGFTAADVASQVRAMYYGAEALRMQRERNEVKVMVRLPEEERTSENVLENLVIIAPGGGDVLLKDMAGVERGRAYTRIKRIDGKRTINVTASVTPKSARGRIQADIDTKLLPELENKYRGLTHGAGGTQREMGESLGSMKDGLLVALIGIFGILGFIFRSYIQPLIVMTAVPFGIVGAVIGHIIMGFDLSIISIMGIIALSGVVVNDSLVLINFANENKRAGQKDRDAVINAGTQRFRPIMLTTLTTFFGLAPMIFETSIQARMLVPMAISLGFGILFSTMITLVLVPSLYVIVEDVRGILGLKEKMPMDSDEDATDSWPI